MAAAHEVLLLPEERREYSQLSSVVFLGEMTMPAGDDLTPVVIVCVTVLVPVLITKMEPGEFSFVT